MPELRFPEFSDNWETVALSDFTERVTRKNVNNESNLPLTISSKDGLVDQISYFNKAVASRNMSGYYLLQNGEFAYNKSYSVGYDFGSIKRLDKYPKGALSTLYICFALKKYDSDFIKIYFDSLKWYREIRMIAAEGARNHGLLNVSADAFFATKHILPQNEKEQEKIAAFMVLLEKKVVLQQQLVDALKLYKRGALSQLFPKNGASVPEYRFLGFTGDWEQRKLGELGEIITGSTPSTSHEEYYSADGIPWVTPTDISENVIYDTPRKLSDEGQKVGRVVPKNTILVTCIASIGKNAILGTTGSFNQQINGIVPNYKMFVPYFLFTESALWSEKMKKQAAAGTMQIVNKTEFSELQTRVPNYQEQEQISTLFLCLDHLITLHQRKLDEYKSIKQGLLEKLFI